MKNPSMFNKLLVVLGSKNSKLIKDEEGHIIRISYGSDECGEFVRVEKEISADELEIMTYYDTDVEVISYRNNYLRKGR